METESPAIELSRRAVKVVAPPPKLNVSEWADAERRLSPESSAEPGQWQTDRAPYGRDIMNAPREEGVRQVVFMASSQVGKTEMLLNLIGYHVHHDPSPMLMVLPTLVLAEAFSKDRLAPMIRDTPALQGKVKDVRARDSGNTLLQKKFPGGHITLAGANSASSLASRPVRLVLCDEIDRFPKSAGTEGSPVKLAEKRSTTFFNRVLFLCSTPTIEGDSAIAAAYENSDRRRYHVPCPHCDHLQVLKFPRLEWELNAKGEPINVLYSCESCGKKFDDSKKDWMLLNGKWIAEAPFTGIAGFHINELYSPWRRWIQTVSEFLEANKNGAEELKVWVNTALGETWKEKGEAPEWERLFHMREKYQIGTVPDQVVFLTAGGDVQKDRIEVEVVGWGMRKESWSIDYHVIEGDTGTEEPWLKLTEFIAKSYPRANGKGELPIRICLIDSGFNTQQVYSWVRTQPALKVRAIKGKDNLSAPIGAPSLVDVNVKGKKIKRGVRIWFVGTNMIKSEIYSWLNLQKPTGSKEPFPLGYCHFPEYDEGFFKMLTAEQLVTKVVKRKPVYEWQKIRERNEALDCRVYARAGAAAVGMDRWTEAHWLAEAGAAGVPIGQEEEPEQHEDQTQESESQPAPPKPDDLHPDRPPRKRRRSSYWSGW